VGELSRAGGLACVLDDNSVKAMVYLENVENEKRKKDLI